MKSPREMAEDALRWMDINDASENDRRVLAMAFHDTIKAAQAEGMFAGRESLKAEIRASLPSKPGKWSEGGDWDDPISLLRCCIEFLENRVADLEDERDLAQ